MKNPRLLIIYFLFTSFILSQTKTDTNIFVDDEGTLRWKKNNEEVSLFGVNYTTPFAYSYRTHKKLNLSLKEAIDLDVAQMVRLGFDAFRVHVWDREISDRNGNLLKNEHLELFDYLLAKLSGNGIKTILTPIAWWGTGWPEPDIETPGFSQVYSKVELITNGKAREAQRNYLKQIMDHVNPYTKFSYKNDPSIIAVEIINEPRHPDNQAQVTQYINELYEVIRETGFTKPIFYNISENWNDSQANAVTKSKIEGISFQWYPTSLVHNKTLDGNYLIDVNEYKIPDEKIENFGNKAKMVYEFDAADIAGSFMYPAMTRSFREAGMQFAAMFSYDPTQLAWSNTEYPTHFLNLLYTPSKAISLMIAGKVFKNVQRYKSYGNFPSNNNFENFRISSEENLSEMNSETEFYYSNSTLSLPKKLESLTNIAGVGNSSVVKYDGTGSYFLDKLENGIWRLEVYPDCIWIRDPFEQTSLSREVARLFWNRRRLEINLPDLDEQFSVNQLNGKMEKHLIVDKNFFDATPGIYLLVSKMVDKKSTQKYLSKREKFLDGIYIPNKDQKEIFVVNSSNQLIADSQDFVFGIAAERKINKVFLFVKRLGWRGFAKYVLKNSGGFDYILADSAIKLEPGDFEYCVTLETEDGIITFPGNIKKSPTDWDFGINQLWKGTFISNELPLVLFDVNRDQKDIVLPHFTEQMRYETDYKTGSVNGKSSLQLKIHYRDSSTIPFGFQVNVKKYINLLKPNEYKNIVIKARTNEQQMPVKVIFLTKNGLSFGTEAVLNNDWSTITIPIQEFKISEALILPNSYPKFLPKIWKSDITGKELEGEILNIEFLQIICNANGKNGELQLDQTLEIESVWLE
ncbi:MAG: cellulase family glycosylhydrolase [Bacteroidota bacterium]